MPELPEVETVARELRSLIIGKDIKEIETFWHKSFDNRSAEVLAGQKVQKIGRQGKYLIIHLTISYLIIHLRMTGQLIFRNGAENSSEKHIRAKIKFQDRSSLYFKDTRKFGRIFHADAISLILKKVGIDALDPNLSETVFLKLLRNRKMNIKAFLLNQNFIAGVGNIYADESLYRAGIHPLSIANKVPIKKLKALFKYILEVLQTATENMGSTISDYRDSYGISGKNQKYLRVYQRTNEQCYSCDTSIEKIRVAGRGTHFCPKCQKVYK